MIECWFNEAGYYIRGDLVESRLIVDDAPEDPYESRWYIFGRMMEILADGEALQESVIIYHDSRLVEELNNQTEPMTPYAKDARAYFLAYDSSKFPNVQIRKTNSASITKAISGS